MDDTAKCYVPKSYDFGYTASRGKPEDFGCWGRSQPFVRAQKSPPNAGGLLQETARVKLLRDCVD